MISSNVFDDDNDNDGNDGLLSLFAAVWFNVFFFIDLIMEYFLFKIYTERERKHSINTRYDRYIWP